MKTLSTTQATRLQAVSSRSWSRSARGRFVPVARSIMSTTCISKNSWVQSSCVYETSREVRGRPIIVCGAPRPSAWRGNKKHPHYKHLQHRVMGPVPLWQTGSSHKIAIQPSHSMNRAGWSAQMASIVFWTPWRNVYKATLNVLDCLLKKWENPRKARQFESFENKWKKICTHSGGTFFNFLQIVSRKRSSEKLTNFTSYKLFLAKRSSEKLTSLKIALRETICKKLKVFHHCVSLALFFLVEHCFRSGTLLCGKFVHFRKTRENEHHRIPVFSILITVLNS